MSARSRTFRALAGIAPGHPYTQAGDALFARGLGALSRAIRWAERSKGEAVSWANHAMVTTRPGYLVPPHHPREPQLAWVSESLWKNTNHCWWPAYRNSPGYSVAVFRPRYLSKAQVDAIVANALSREGDPYGWWRLFTFLGRRVLGLDLPKLHLQQKAVVCSNHQGLAELAGNVSLGKPPNELDPDDGMDWALSHPEDFEFRGWAMVPPPSPTSSPLALLAGMTR